MPTRRFTPATSEAPPTLIGTVGSADSGQGIFVASNGIVYITGYTTSIDLPLVGASQGVNAGSYDAFVAKFDPSQSGTRSLLFAPTWAGSRRTGARISGLIANGLIYVTGFTFSTDFPFTAATAFANYSGEGDAFLSVIDPGQGIVVYSTFFGGGDGFDEANRILVDPAGKSVVIAGYTLATTLPVTQNAYQSVMPALSNVDASGNQLGSNGFLAIINTKTTAPNQGLLYSTYFGGFGGEVDLGLANRIRKADIIFAAIRYRKISP